MIIDLVLLAIFVLTVIFAVKKGFFATLFELVSTLLAFILAKALSSQYAPILYQKFFQNGFEENIKNSLNDVGSQDYSAKINGMIESIPDSLSGVMNTFFGLDKQALANQVSDANLTGENLVQGMIDILTPIVVGVISVVLFIVLSILLIIILKVVIKLLDKVIKKLPLIKQANSLLGGVAGALKGVFVVVIVSLLLALFSGIIANESFVNMVNDSMIISTTKDLIATFNA